MTQYDTGLFEPSDTGVQLATDLNGLVDSLLTNHKGPARPSYVRPSMLWVDDSGSNWLLKLFDGTADVAIATINPTTHAVVGTKASLRNRIINSAAQVCQDRATGATVALSSSGYAFDGFQLGLNGSATLLCSQVAKATPGGSPYRFRAAVSVAQGALAAGDYHAITLPIEGVDVADLQLGTPAAKAFTWRGVVNFPAGTWGLTFSNGASTRSYVTTFEVSPTEAGTDKLISVVVPGDTVGTWIKDASGVGIWVKIVLAVGANAKTGTIGAWQNGAYASTAAQTNGVASTANVFEIADIGLYAGSELPEWEMPDQSEDLSKCRRYRRYAKILLLSNGSSAFGGAVNEIDVTGLRVSPALSVFVANSSPAMPASDIATSLYDFPGYKTAIFWFNSTKAFGNFAELTVTIDARL